MYPNQNIPGVKNVVAKNLKGYVEKDVKSKLQPRMTSAVDRIKIFDD